MGTKNDKKWNKKQWSKNYGDAKIGFWNPWFYSNERHEYSKSLNLDILGLGELHNLHDKTQYKEKRWICSDTTKIKDGKSTDPAAGVAILLSKRMADKIMSSGSVGTRIVWARLEGPVCNLFVIVVYIPHKGRSNPCAQDTINQIKVLLSTVRSHDCIILMGDFNCQLRRNVSGCTGKWCMTKRKDNGHGEEMLNLLRRFDLFAVDTLFKPARKALGEKKRMRYCTGNVTHVTPEAKIMSKRLQMSHKRLVLDLSV